MLCLPERVLWLNFIIFCTVWCIKQNKNADRRVEELSMQFIGLI